MNPSIRALYRLFAFIIGMISLAHSLMAADWQATQGDVVTVEMESPEIQPTLRCFGKAWPVQAIREGLWRGWVGVDLSQKPGNYPLIWQGREHTLRQQLTVIKGNFRISNITVEKKMAVFDKPTLARIRSEVKVLKATYTMPVEAAPAISMAALPVQGVISTPFGAQRYVNGEPRSPHSGLDIAAPAGTPVQAPLDGKVLLVADMYLNGNTIALGHGNGLVSVYSHMLATRVRQGDWVRAGSILGEVGASGRATGPHLHWGIRFNNARINPDSLLQHVH
jgi:murein DD-endopeptidase MepM/ murein hydrolase activator NlpD